MALVPTHRVQPATGYRSIAVVMAGVLLGACATPPPAPPPIPDPSPPPEIVPDTRLSEDIARQASEIQSLRRRITGFETRIVELELRVLEKDTQLAEVQGKLDDAIQEAIRANAKLQSVASRAQAASTLAEAEAGLRALQAAVGGDGPGPEIIRAERLLEMSSAEFDNQNYGGSVYLTRQAKGLIAVARGRLGDSDLPVRAGETLFAGPLPFRVWKTANVREGPGNEFRVLFVVTQGTPLEGQAQEDQWMRIRDDQGRVGWIYQTLVDSRPQGDP